MKTKYFALSLLLLSTLTRFIGQMFDVNTVAALALVVDVYAIGLLLGLEQRQRPLSAFWLAVLFAFTLPLENQLQRLVGYGLQQISAQGACQLLSLGNDTVACAGVDIMLAGQEVLVDLPCSGARGLLHLLVLFSALAALTRPVWWQSLIGLSITLVAAWLSNVFRITVLALGIVYADNWGIDVMAEPYHDLIGLLALGIGVSPILLWAITLPKRPPAPTIHHTFPPIAHRWYWQGLAFAFVCLAAVIIYLPAQPLDVARPMNASAVQLPQFIDHYAAQEQELSALERHFFARYGGAAVKAQYGQFNVVKVSTNAPLRHLHNPEACLRGSGHEVQYLNMTRQGLPTAFYQSTDPQGNVWQIRVTYIGDDGSLMTNISEVIWRWLRNPGMTWSLLQRIAPAEVSAAEFDAWDMAMSRAFDLSVEQ